MNNNNLLKNRLTNDYIAGFIQGNGNFEIELYKRISKKITKIVLVPNFTLTQKTIRQELMLNIIQRINAGGHYLIDNKNIMRYKVRDLNNILKGIIPFFSKHQLKDDKLLNFIKYRYIVEKLSTIDENYKWYNKNLENKYNPLILDLITISTHMNKNTKLSNQLNLLSLEDKDKVLNNKLSLNIEKELKDYINNFNYIDNFNSDFINGLFDTNGWITLRLNLNKKKTSNNLLIGWDLGIISDNWNLKILNDIKNYFNNVGNIYNEKTYSSYRVSKLDCLSNVFIKLFNVKSYLDIINNNYIKGPLINDIKIKKLLVILELHKDYLIVKDIDPKKGLQLIEKMILISYEIRDDNYKNKKPLNLYLTEMRKKLNLIN